MREPALLLLFAARHYGYYQWPVAMWGDVFAIAGSLAIIACVLMIDAWLPLRAWIVAEEALVVSCSIWWMVSPAVGEGDACATRLGLKLGAFGLAVVALLAAKVWQQKRADECG